ncbi:hypothetical protein ACFE04_010945 [Oxalis oulophora]
MDDDSVVGPVETSSSPDLLKNTASNIARLENVIEHSKGRYKYHAHTNSPSDGSNVRWYFCKLPLSFNELAASIPRTEIVGKGDYFRFGIRVSLAIKASFLQREDDLLSSWWIDYAECSAGPGNTPPTTSTNNQQPHHFTSNVGKRLVGIGDINAAIQCSRHLIFTANWVNVELYCVNLEPSTGCKSCSSIFQGTKAGRSLLIEDGALSWIVQNANNERSLSAAGAAFLSAVIVNPLDVVKKRRDCVLLDCIKSQNYTTNNVC